MAPLPAIPALAAATEGGLRQPFCSARLQPCPRVYPPLYDTRVVPAAVGQLTTFTVAGVGRRGLGRLV